MADPVTEFEKYREELLAALGNDDPVGVLSSTMDEVSRLVANASPEQLNRRPAPNEWSARHALGHLAETHLVYGVRIRKIVT